MNDYWGYGRKEVERREREAEEQRRRAIGNQQFFRALLGGRDDG